MLDYNYSSLINNIYNIIDHNNSVSITKCHIIYIYIVVYIYLLYMMIFITQVPLKLIQYKYYFQVYGQRVHKVLYNYACRMACAANTIGMVLDGYV